MRKTKLKVTDFSDLLANNISSHIPATVGTHFLNTLKESPCPNHPAFRLGSLTQLEIYVCTTRIRIFTFLECQETYTGKG